MKGSLYAERIQLQWLFTFLSVMTAIGWVQSKLNIRTVGLLLRKQSSLLRSMIDKLALKTSHSIRHECRADYIGQTGSSIHTKEHHLHICLQHLDVTHNRTQDTPQLLHLDTGHQYPGLKIQAYRQDHQENPDLNLSQQHKQGIFLPEQVMEASHSHNEEMQEDFQRRSLDVTSLVLHYTCARDRCCHSFCELHKGPLLLFVLPVLNFSRPMVPTDLTSI